MKKYTLVKVASYIVAAKYLAPILFKALPSPLNLNMFWLLIWVLISFINYPSLFKNRVLIPLYIWAIYFIIILGIFSSNETYIDFYYQKYFISWLASITISMFYLIIAPKKDTMHFVKINLILILFSCLSSTIGFQIFPESVRFNHMSAISPYSIEEGIKRSDFFQSIGIQPYGFFYGLAVIIPAIMYYLMNLRYMNGVKNAKVKISVAITLIYISMISANYATAFLLSVVGVSLTIYGYRRMMRSKILIFVLLGLVFFTPTNWQVNSVLSLSQIAEDNSMLQKRLVDFSQSLSGDTETHVSARLDRIPILIENFISSPIWGTGRQLSHNFLFDVLSAYGLIGFSLFFFVFYNIYNFNRKVFKKKYAFYYFLIFLLFAIYAPLKGIPGGIMYYFIFALSPLFIYSTQYSKLSHINGKNGL